MYHSVTLVDTSPKASHLHKILIMAVYVQHMFEPSEVDKVVSEKNKQNP